VEGFLYLQGTQIKFPESFKVGGTIRYDE
jgi:hypothetical protein